MTKLYRAKKINPYGSAIPIALYRELVNELEATRAQLAATEAAKQQLIQYNQQIQQELQTLMQAAQSIQGLALVPISSVTEDLEPFIYSPQADRLNRHSNPQLKGNNLRPLWQAKSFGKERSPQQYATVAVRQTRPTPQQQVKLNSWIMGFVILGVVLTSFVGGFVLVRPFLSK